MATKADEIAPDNSFEEAFADLTLPETKEPVAVDPPVVDEDAPKVEEPAVVEEAVVETQVVEEPKDEAPVVKTPAVEEPKDDEANEILAKLTKLVKEAPAAPEPKATETAETATEAVPEIYNDEEKAFLDDYKKDWGDVQRGEALIRKAEYRDLVGYIFSQVVDFVKPIQETAQSLATRTHLSDIETAVPDYSDQLREEVTAWVAAQPAYLQPAYNHVINEGTVDEVKDLIDRYRSSTGKGAGAPAPTKKDNELSGEAKKAAAALAPVESKRSGPTQTSDPSDFDSAWKQASVELGS